MRIESSLVQEPVLGSQLAKEQLIANGYGVCNLAGGSNLNLKTYKIFVYTVNKRLRKRVDRFACS